MTGHDVEKHLRLRVQEYDVIIRTMVPHYDEMISTGVDVLTKIIPPASLVVDLGSGTGRLAEAVSRRLPDTRVVLLDIDEKMLEQAKGRLGESDKRFTFKIGSFHHPLPVCDAVVASLSLHHVKDFGDKRRIYSNVNEALQPGGLFLLMDASVSDDAKIARLEMEEWINHMGKHGIMREQAEEYLSNWKKEERYFSIHEELSALTASGFEKPEVFWRKGPMAVFGALRA